MRKPHVAAVAVMWLFAAGAISSTQGTSSQTPVSTRPTLSAASADALLDRYCVTCHNDRRLARGDVPVAFEPLNAADVRAHAETWEQIVRKVRLGMMPPPGSPRPDAATYDAFLTWLEGTLDRAAAANPNPGRPPVRRLTTAEYVNAIGSLLQVDVDEQSLLLPADDADQQGFTTNAEVLSLSPALFDRYLAAANRISRIAMGDPTVGPGFAAGTYSTPRLLYQDDRMSEDLPFGSRGGMAVRHVFPVDGEYEIRIRLRRMIYDYVVGMGKPQQLDVRLDGALVKQFTVGDADKKGYPSAYTFFGTIRGDLEWEEYMSTGADAGLQFRVPVHAGTHVVGVAFANAQTEPTGILERRLSGFALSGTDFYLGNAAIERVEILGPYTVTGAGDTPSRRHVFTCRPPKDAAVEEERCAKEILSRLARRAYRRPVADGDLQPLLTFYRTGRQERGFEGGIRRALERLLVAPEFLFRIEREPANAAPGTVYQLSDLELASRLSLFLWSDIPDEALLAEAEQGRLHDPAVVERQVRRMMADARADALVDNFASQWLQLDRLSGVTPDADVFFEFDENLRADMEQETRLFLESQLREDRGLPDLLTANYTFVNERLAGHYGIPNVYGERFRRVTLESGDRAGLLGHASLLTVTAYPTRTSPVLRGKWLLDNLLGMPPPPPPPDVPALEENRGDGKALSIRERMEQHRANPACAGCHRMMDPPGFALEKFDAVGRWRTTNEGGAPIDAAGSLADGTAVDGPASLRAAVLAHKESYVRTVIEKLLTFAIGRRLEFYDQPAVRKIAAAARAGNYRWSSIIVGIARSTPFQMRRSES